MIRGKYMKALAGIPAPGTGCHAALLGIADLGILAGYSDAEILTEIQMHIPAGKRHIPNSEIMDAIRRAHKDTVPMTCGRKTWNLHRIPPPCRRTQAEITAEALKSPDIAAAFRSSVLKAGGNELDPLGADLFDVSPIKIDAYSEEMPYLSDSIQLLEALYSPADLLFCGNIQDSGQDSIKTVGEWCAIFRAQIYKAVKAPENQRRTILNTMANNYPLFLPNPVSGREEPRKSGDGTTFRGDACVSCFRYVLLESDSMPFPECGQILRGLSKAGFRFCSLVFSGNRSIHALMKPDQEIHCLSEWELYSKSLFVLLKHCGFDPATGNAARMTRLPGIFRPGTQQWQRLLWLCPEGGQIR